MAQCAGLSGDAAAVKPGNHIHALLIANRLERLTDVALKRDAGEVLLQGAAIDEIGAGAGTQRDAGDRRLALAGRAVAGPRGQVDRGTRDRLDDRLLAILLG